MKSKRTPTPSTKTNSRIIGLTGGIASGKSLVSDYLVTLGIPMIDTDEIARQVVAPGQPAWHALFKAFGAEYFLANGEVDRAALARYVFIDPLARQQLEALTHPMIFQEVDRRIDELLQSSPAPRLIFVVVPLLFETNAESRFHSTVLVHATPALQRERLMMHRGYTSEEADARIRAQLPSEEKKHRADHLLENTGSEAELYVQVDRLLTQLSSDDMQEAEQ